MTLHSLLSIPPLLFSILVVVQGEGIILKRFNDQFGFREIIGVITIAVGIAGIISTISANILGTSSRYSQTMFPFFFSFLFLVPQLLLALFSVILIFVNTSIPSASSRCTIGLDITWVWGGGNQVCTSGQGSKAGWIALGIVKCLFIAIIGGLWSANIWKVRLAAILEHQVKEAEDGYSRDYEKHSIKSWKRKEPSIESLGALGEPYANTNSHFLTQKEVGLLADQLQRSSIKVPLNDDFDAPIPTSPRGSTLRFGFDYTPIAFTEDKEKVPEYRSSRATSDGWSQAELTSLVEDREEVTPQLPPIQIQQQSFAGWIFQSIFQGSNSNDHVRVPDHDQDFPPTTITNKKENVDIPSSAVTHENTQFRNIDSRVFNDSNDTKSIDKVAPINFPATPIKDESYESYNERVDHARPRTLSRKRSNSLEKTENFKSPPLKSSSSKEQVKKDITIAGTPYHDIPIPDFPPLPPVAPEQHPLTIPKEKEPPKPKVFVSIFGGGSLVRKLSTIASESSESPGHFGEGSLGSLMEGDLERRQMNTSMYSTPESVRDEFESVIGRVKKGGALDALNQQGM